MNRSSSLPTISRARNNEVQMEELSKNKDMVDPQSNDFTSCIKLDDESANQAMKPSITNLDYIYTQHIKLEQHMFDTENFGILGTFRFNF
mmetsp:Transcript_76188/g.164877  ORF Transcript_76188/g.164877 Transcript_76188/m.164877 type:complete len:90 (+) Transcript_76188:856-1125(+)